MATDAEIRAKGIKFLPLQKYLQNPYEFPVEETPPVEDGGITNTNAFNNSGNDFNPAGNNFQNNTNVLGLRTPGSDFASSGSYVTNRTNSGSMLPGAEEEDNFLQKILKAGGRGIAAMIPGAGMLTSVADKFDRFDDLNPLDQEFINSQMSGYEQNIHGTQNLPQQDRYGYNKRSALGNYSELIDERMDIAKGFINKDHPDADEDGYYRPIDKYYNDKFKDKNTIQSQMDMNDKVRNHIINQKAQSGPAINNPFSKEYSGNTKSPNYTPTGPNQPDPTPTPTNNDDRNDTSNSTNSNPSTPGAQDSFSNKSGKGRTGYFFGGRVNYKKGGRIGFQGGGMDMGNEENQAQSAAMGNTTVSNNNDDGGSQNINVTKEIQKAIEKKIPKTEDAPLMSDKIKKYFTLSSNNKGIDSMPFLRNSKKTKNLYTNNLTNLNIQYPNIDIKDEYGYIQGDKAKSLIDRAIAEGTISPVEGLNLTRSIDTTGTQSNTSGNYTIGNFNFNSPNIEEGILNSGVNYNLGDLNLNANLNTNDSTINDSRLGFNYDNDSLTGSTYRDNDYGYTTNKLGVDKTFNIGDNFKVGLDGSYQEDKFKDGSYYNADLTPSLTYNDGTFNANLSKEIVEGGTQPSLGIGFQKNGFYGQGNNLLSDPTGKIGFQYSTGPETYTSRRGEFNKQGVNFTGGFEIDPFTGKKTAGAYLSKAFKNGGLAGLL